MFRVGAILLLAPAAPANAAVNAGLKFVTKTVVTLYAATAAGNAVDPNHPLGSGFLLEIPLLSNPNQSYKALVTARHVVDPVWAKCPSATNPTVVYARVNKRAYDPTSGISGIEFVRVDLQKDGAPSWWHFHDDDVDAAVLPVQVNYSLYDVNALHPELFPSDLEMAGLETGDRVMSVGLLPEEKTRNYPITTFGRIANIPLEDVETRCAPKSPILLLKEWLIAPDLGSANGGAPIFNVPAPGPDAAASEARPLILGVQALSYPGTAVVGMTPIGYVYQILRDLKLPDANLKHGVH